MLFEKSSDLSAFGTQTIGTKVLDHEGFLRHLEAVVVEHDESTDDTAGQHFVHLPESAWLTVSAGVGHNTANPDDYVVRVHRGQVSAFLRREKAAKLEGLAVVVYTKAAYLVDPDVMAEPDEMARITVSECTHVIVAVLGFAGPKASLTPYRLVHNLAGGNNAVEAWSKDDILVKARESKGYWDKWCVVAD